MAYESKFSVCVNKDHMGHSLHAVVLVAGGASLMQVLNRFPLLFSNVLNYDLWCLIDANSDYAHLVAPAGSVVLEHLLVVRHWCLAWRAPGSPEI